MQPMKGYLIAKTVERKTSSGIILAEGQEENNKDIIVERVDKDCKQFTKGDNIVLRPNGEALMLKDEPDTMIVAEDAICAIR